MTHLLIAFAIVTGDQDSRPEFVYDPILAMACQTTAICLEIMDRRELNYLFRTQEEWGQDVHRIRQRYYELMDAPPIGSITLPDIQTINEYIKFNRETSKYIGGTFNGEERLSTLCECDKLCQIWSIAREATCDYYYVSVRRMALKNLREYIGNDNYYNGNMPPFVPLWRFREIE